jgi:predicted nucleotidyltransferase component of viral defense system
VTGNEPRNIPASVLARLKNKLTPDRTFDRILVQYGIERLLYRLSKSQHANTFVLKGAQLFLLWTGSYYRPTKDLDLLAKGSADLRHLEQVWREVCGVPCPEDGLVFVMDSVKAEEIHALDEYGGVRVCMKALLGRARISLQIDMGFGDAVTPNPESRSFPVLLDLPIPRLQTYPRETVVAEKFEALVKLGINNSRMKDFYDLWALASDFEFNGAFLLQAITATFKRRKTTLPEDTPLALTPAFHKDDVKRIQWNAFLKKSSFSKVERDLVVVTDVIGEFVMPPVEASREKSPFRKTWPPGGPWS